MPFLASTIGETIVLQYAGITGTPASRSPSDSAIYTHGLATNWQRDDYVDKKRGMSLIIARKFCTRSALVVGCKVTSRAHIYGTQVTSVSHYSSAAKSLLIQMN